MPASKVVLEVSKGRYLPAVLRERSFARLFAGQTASSVGTWMAIVAMPFAALELGATPGQLGVVLAAQNVPFALLALFAGAWADRFDRARMIVLTDLVSVAAQAALAALLLSGAAQLWQLAVLGAVHGAASACAQPALIGLVPATVGLERTQEANALLRTSSHAGQLVAAPIGGALVAVVGAGWVFAIDAATYVASAAWIAGIPRARQTRDRPAEPTLQAIATGWRAVRERPWIARFLAVLSTYFCVVLPTVFVLGPVIAERDLDGATSWGIIRGAFAVGAVAGSVLAMRWRPKAPMRAAGCAFAVASLGPAVVALAATTAVIAALQALLAIAAALAWTFWESTVQSRVPEDLVSRVISFDFLVSVGSLPLGMAAVGPVAGALGVQATMVGASVIGVLAALAYAFTPAAAGRSARSTP
jgi:MFS family permease